MSYTIKTSEDSFKIDYTTEKFEDEVLETIKNFCLSYLNDSKTSSNASDEELLAMFTFLSVKIQDVNMLKKSFDIKKYNFPFINCSKIIDEITLSDSILSKTERPNLFLLTKELNYISDILSLCFKIVKKIGKKRKLI